MCHGKLILGLDTMLLDRAIFFFQKIKAYAFPPFSFLPVVLEKMDRI